jgi:CheY-like chemotaxis protein
MCGLVIVASDAECPHCTGGTGEHHRHEAAVIPPPARGLEAPREPDRRYEVLETIGRGGMGIVYKVRDLELDEVIAFKVLDPQFGRSAEAVERFKREIKIARRINHPSVARLYDLVAWRGQLAISMEFIEGRSVDEVLVADGPLPFDSVRRYLRYLCSGLQAAHRTGVVHRDLKPANILIDREDRAHVLDFGIAQLAGLASADAPGRVFGTAAYMSPEQAFSPDRVDRRSDIYSLGVVLYKMLTGQVPFPGPEPHEVFFDHLRKKPTPPSKLRDGMPGALEGLVLRCLEKDPEDRFQEAREVFAALERTVEEKAPPPRPGGKVLVVDDDPLSRAVVTDVLRAHGHAVVEATNGYEAVQAALQERPDLVLLDLLMPVLDGREALRILKTTRATAGIPVVMLTSLTDPEEAMLSRETGAVAYLNKPVEGDVLAMVVDKHLGAGRKPA